MKLCADCRQDLSKFKHTRECPAWWRGVTPQERARWEHAWATIHARFERGDRAGAAVRADRLLAACIKVHGHRSPLQRTAQILMTDDFSLFAVSDECAMILRDADAKRRHLHKPEPERSIVVYTARMTPAEARDLAARLIRDADAADKLSTPTTKD